MFKNKFFIFCIIFFSFIVNVNFADVNQNQQTRIIVEQSTQKPIEEITALDIIQNENISQGLKQRIIELINQSQFKLEQYKGLIYSYQKENDLKFIKTQETLDATNETLYQMQTTFELAKWMVISLSIGIICLTGIMLIMWRSVVNVNRNDVEVIFILEKTRKEIKELENKIEFLEGEIKK